MPILGRVVAPTRGVWKPVNDPVGDRKDYKLSPGWRAIQGELGLIEAWIIT